MASAETIHNLLLPAKTAVHDKKLPAETVCMTVLPAETVCMTVLPAKTLGRKLSQEAIFRIGSLERNQKVADSLDGSQNW